MKLGKLESKGVHAMVGLIGGGKNFDVVLQGFCEILTQAQV